MQYINQVLQNQSYVAGQDFSMADITVIGGLIFAELVNLEIPAECQNLKRWYKAMPDRPSVANRLTLHEAGAPLY